MSNEQQPGERQPEKHRLKDLEAKVEAKLKGAQAQPSRAADSWLDVWFDFVLLILVLLGGWYYTTTEDFQKRVGKQVVSVLEDATGGKVDLGHLSFSLAHLAIEVDGLVIHGTEAAGEAPYLSAAKILVRLKINTFLSHTVGKGAQSHVGLSFLRVERRTST